MKKISAPSAPIPRLESLQHRLEHASAPDGEPDLDRLMAFLDDPPPGVTDRWKEGATMCSAWGVSCTGPSVWRLYRSQAAAWRARREIAAEAEAETAEALGKKAARMIALRTCEMLADPQASSASVIGLAAVELRRQALELARRKHEQATRSSLDQAFQTIEGASMFNWGAQFAIDRLKEALGRPTFSPVMESVMKQVREKVASHTAHPPDPPDPVSAS